VEWYGSSPRVEVVHEPFVELPLGVSVIILHLSLFFSIYTVLLISLNRELVGPQHSRSLHA
jgi:hypothetical protein